MIDAETEARVEAALARMRPPEPTPGIVVPAEPTGPSTEPDKAIAGDAFVLDHPAVGVPALWGRGQQVMWAAGEALMIAGGQGLGKTTLAGQLLRGLTGLTATVLGLPVTDTGCPILYLAMDRPSQIGRSMARQFTEADRGVLAERVKFWKGPPPRDLAANPALLARMADHYKAGVVFVDSLKDAAVGLSEDEVGARYNRARQHLLAQGVQLVELHHTKKRGIGTAKRTVDDIYGSTWLTSGCGSVVMLDGEPGDPIVRFEHVKQPAEQLGPWRLLHDQAAGVLSIEHSVDLVALVRAGGPDGLTARAAAAAVTESNRPGRSDIEKARRRLEVLAAEGVLVHMDGRNEHGGKSVRTWFLAADDPNHATGHANHEIRETAGQTITLPLEPGGNHATVTPITRPQKTAGQAIT